MQRNPDDHRHHASLLSALQLSPSDPSQREELVLLYNVLAEDYPRSMAVRRIPLDFLVSLSGCLCLLACGKSSSSG